MPRGFKQITSPAFLVLSAPFFQRCIVGPGAVVEPVVLGVALGAVDPRDHGLGAEIMGWQNVMGRSGDVKNGQGMVSLLVQEMSAEVLLLHRPRSVWA